MFEHERGEFVFKDFSFLGKVNAVAFAAFGIGLSPDQTVFFHKVQDSGHGLPVFEGPFGQFGLMQTFGFPVSIRNGRMLRGDFEPLCVGSLVKSSFHLRRRSGDDVSGGVIQGKNDKSNFHLKRNINNTARQAVTLNSITILNCPKGS